MCHAIDAMVLSCIGLMFPVDEPLAAREVVAKYVAEKDYFELNQTVSAWQKLPLRDKVRLTAELSTYLPKTDHHGLLNPGALHNPYREKRGDLKPPDFQGYYTEHDLFITGGKASWAIYQLIGTSIPSLDAGLGPLERAIRIAVIRDYVAKYKLVVTYLLEPDVPTLLAQVRKWQRLPLVDRVRILELLLPATNDPTPIGLKGHENIVKIGYRIETGDMKPGPFKFTTGQDLYIVGGKAAWAIGELIETVRLTLPEITDAQTEAERYRATLAIGAVVEAYKTGIGHAKGSGK